MDLSDFGVELGDHKNSRKRSSGSGLGVSYPPKTLVNCESCSYTGTSFEVASHRENTHDAPGRFEVRRVTESGFEVVKVSYSRLAAEAIVRSRGSGLTYKHELYDRWAHAKP